jgi:hypothetical protein
MTCNRREGRDFVERLRYEVDPKWQGEIPLTLLIAADGTTTYLEGVAALQRSTLGWMRKPLGRNSCQDRDPANRRTTCRDEFPRPRVVASREVALWARTGPQIYFLREIALAMASESSHWSGCKLNSLH